MSPSPLSHRAIAKRAGATARTPGTPFFASSVGETPGAYYLRLRLNAARRLVVDTRVPLADIAARTGFSSASTFAGVCQRIRHGAGEAAKGVIFGQRRAGGVKSGPTGGGS